MRDNPGSVLSSGSFAMRLESSGRYSCSLSRAGRGAAGGGQTYFGVEGETLYVTPEEEMTGWVSNPETETLSEWNSRIKDSRFFLWVNLEQV